MFFSSKNFFLFCVSYLNCIVVSHVVAGPYRRKISKHRLFNAFVILALNRTLILNCVLIGVLFCE